MKNFFKLDKPTFSFEIFPPKGAGDLSQIFGTVDALASLDPDLISVTYGAGGTSRENTAEIASRIQRDYAIPALAHLTCVGSTREEMRATLDKLKEKGIQNILAMRGDLGSDETKDFKYASELIKFINENYSFRIFAACYPEKHLEAYSMEEDLEHLRAKCECGVSVLISQLFFDNASFYSFRERARKLGVAAPIEAGIMPVMNAKSVLRMSKMCESRVPEKLAVLLDKWGSDTALLKEAGIAYASEQICDLAARGVDGVHLYTMNHPCVSRRIWSNVKPFFV